MRPDTFIQELNARCDVTGQRPYRIRFNERLSTFMIEQKVSRAIEVPAIGDDFATSRVRDGYALVLQGHTKPFLICGECDKQHVLPVLKSAEIRCDCHLSSELTEKQMWFTGYYPLCDSLLTSLERTAPKRGMAWIKEMNEENKRIAAEPRRKRRQSLMDISGDYFKQVGYGHGPASHGVL
jgi:hypothetical protein